MASLDSEAAGRADVVYLGVVFRYENIQLL